MKLHSGARPAGLRLSGQSIFEKAISIDPSNVLARALLGQLAYRGDWGSTDAVAQKDPE